MTALEDDQVQLDATPLDPRGQGPDAPWHVIGANFKWHTRVKALEALLSTIAKGPFRDSAL